MNTQLIIIGAVIGLVIAVIATLTMKSSMKPVIKASTASDYAVPGSFRVTRLNEFYLRTDTVRIPKPKQQPQQNNRQ